ncbi:ecto-ADP-ribosyltransferase 4-like isoform X1 [Pundamilia nyererei]|uniref:NAD(P)(+)--arginine ADP-ribosyltransferase n=2 Tax=Pundamilia nyererei TaxID=303518 RepID=A0A9Y3VYL4_9CICH|nr:PREDICTED: ecto-ADP-ribosyltransferase 4-like isoform X1 [Pundamilia nyererei]
MSLVEEQEDTKMENRRKVLVVAIIFTVACNKVTAQETRLLDFLNNTNVVDDQYKGCGEEAMKRFIESDVLKRELNNSEGFQKAWNKSIECSKQIPGGRKEHTAALSVYVNGDHNLLQRLNKAIETMGGNVSIYENRFHFKSLHFLLMDSMRLLKPKECKNVYVLLSGQNQPQKGSTVRFPSFTSAYSDYEKLKSETDLYEEVVLNLTSCFFVNLKDYVCGQGQDEILLSPAEVFTVEDINSKVVEADDDSQYVEIVLKHSGLKSSHNCYIFSRSPPAVVSTLWLVSVLLALSLFCFLGV